MPKSGQQGAGHGRHAPQGQRLWVLLGPAFVASVAYVDPGNVAANLTAGAQYGYLLVWVLVVSNAMAVLIQFLSAKLGLVTGASLPQLLGDRWGRLGRIAYWGQAEVVAAATDLAEVIGGAIALNLLFGLPLLWGAVITGAISMAMLAVQSRRGQRHFEFVIITFLAVIAVGFLAGLFVSPVDWTEAAAGLIPRFGDSGTVLLAASMLGATVMPHAIYAHSALVRDRHRPHGPVEDTADDAVNEAGIARLVKATKVDVVWSLAIAGSVNIAMLLLAAAALRGVEGTDTIAGAYSAIEANLGITIAVIFAVGLLASGLAATSVGAYAGAVIMGGLLRRRIPLLLRRMVTLVPAIVIIAVGIDPTYALILSQVVLSVGIPFALVPLVRLTADRAVMGAHVNGAVVRTAAWAAVVAIIALNCALIIITILGG